MRALVLWLVAGIVMALATPTVAGPPPELGSWILNTDGHTGYAGILADVQAVYFSDGYVYVESTGIPSYAIGPWPGNPNNASNQNWRFKITRNPVAAASHAATPLGQIGLWTNGVVMYNAKDAFSYMNQNVWHQNAVVVEASSFDACLGHPQPSGAYHHHQNPPCLYPATDTTQHSPILGYAFDGFPVYGPYAYANANGSGGVRRIHSSYRLRNISQRTTLPDGTVLSPSQYGPPVSSTYPLGYYIEDFEYVAGLGDLDEYNVRFSITPEYLTGTYAYFVTLNVDGSSAYPYIAGPNYFGTLVAGNTGGGGGHVTISEPVTRYDPSLVGVGLPAGSPMLALGPPVPNPAGARTMLPLMLGREAAVTIRVLDVSGRKVGAIPEALLSPGSHVLPLNVGSLAPGVYRVEASANGSTVRSTLIVTR